MSNELENNPFIALFGSTSEAQSFCAEQSSPEVSSKVENVSATTNVQSSSAEDTLECNANDNASSVINDIVEEIFGFTLKKENKRHSLIFLDELAAAVAPQEKIDIETLEQALFERLLLEDPVKHVVKFSSNIHSSMNRHAVEKEVLTYLFECHRQLLTFGALKPSHKQIISEMDGLVIRNVTTAITQPDLYASQNLTIQFIALFNEVDVSKDHIVSLLMGVVDTVLKDEGDDAGLETLKRAFFPILDDIQRSVTESNLITLNRYHMCLLNVFSSIPVLGDVVLSHSTPADMKIGSAFGNTLFGVVLSTSCMPRSNSGRYEFFDRPLETIQINKSVEGTVWTGLMSVCDCMHSVFHNILKNSPLSRHKLLSWIANCLHSNAGRGKLWNSHSFDLGFMNSMGNVSDGFMMNLSSVLLRLCQPFTDPKAVEKLLKVDPTYCAAMVKDENESKERGIHMKGLASETCFISLNGDDHESSSVERPVSSNYNFVTECFFMTHKSLDLGMRVVLETMHQLNQNLATLQRNYEAARARGGANSELAQSLSQQLESGMTKFLSIRAALLEPKSLELVGDFLAATAVWLVQLAVHPLPSDGVSTYAPLSLITVSFPLPTIVSPVLSCIPEFVLENVVCCQSMVRRYSPQTLEERGAAFLEPLLSLVVVYMGSKHRLRNPHLRARLAECLHSLLPQGDNEESSALVPRTVGWINRDILFRNHPHKHQIVRSLLDVFVGIEMTGEGVAFEHKFNYRYPMYAAMDYLWSIPEHRNIFKQMAEEAEANMEAVHPPLFLRFLNLLMNDAVYLLDEALSSMAQLRTMQTARENNEWARLPRNEQVQNEQTFLQIGMTARSLNILGKATIHTLEYLTTKIKSIFSHPTMVDRIAAMLNYFLVHLVGPKKKNLKVKDLEEYKFKPADLVLDICKIYVNLGDSDAFCLAVSQDGRSYNPQLFRQAEIVLVRIGGGNLIAELSQVASRVAEQASHQQTEEEILAEAPDEFLDPIMSCIMMDPVILPSSRTTVDRSTIARHLLSDQTDPFNRSPLTMDQVKPNIELREKILKWVNDRKSQQASRNVIESRTSQQGFESCSERRKIKRARTISSNISSETEFPLRFSRKRSASV